MRFPPYKEETRFGVELECGEDSLLDAVNRCVSDMITTTVITAAADTINVAPKLLTLDQREKMYKVRWHSAVSVAWTNIQVELVQRNNSLLSTQKEVWSLQHSNGFCHQQNAATATDKIGSNNYYNMLPKRNCLSEYIFNFKKKAKIAYLKIP